MKRYLAFVLMTAILLSSLAITPASAAQPGEAIGNVLYSDVVAYIDGYPIRSYNINGYTYIVAEDLLSYGFYVEWRVSEGKLIIHTARTANYTASYVPEKNTHAVGSIAFPYLYTNVTTWIGTNQITGHNIGGNTCICMDDLYKYFGGSYVWNPDDVTLRLSTVNTALQTSPATTPVLPKVEQNPTNAFQKLKKYTLTYGKPYDDGDYIVNLCDYSSDNDWYLATCSYFVQDDKIALSITCSKFVYMLYIEPDQNPIFQPYKWVLSVTDYDNIMIGSFYADYWTGDKNGPIGVKLSYTQTDFPYHLRDLFAELGGAALSLMLEMIDIYCDSVITLDELGFV
ncbi:MAG: hypothetical protein IJC15_05830, partial [Clostridia bacterium]|nr:hypothetical protein [Clostridia bacterium]